MNLFQEILIEYISNSILIIYFFCLILIFLFSISQAYLVYHYLKSKKQKNNKLFLLNRKLPKVTIQLPIYNEIYVIERLFKKVSELKYPKKLLQIQVLDDSDDQSTELIIKLIKNYKSKGIKFEHITRSEREGFKAGALKNGLKSASGEFIAIFDADFMPDSNWLKKIIPYFENKKIGLIQTRWGHLNKSYSILTKVQAFALDIHFTLEQVGRNIKNHFMNFNGTAGIWRKKCIIDSGNWEGDTLTEDLDLSFRAQLKGWKFKYIEHVVTPAELPITINAVKSQQYRWNKGGAENFQKIFWKLVKSKSININTKIIALIHLLSSSMFLNVFIVSCLSVPLLILNKTGNKIDWFLNFSSIFILSTIILFICYWIIHKMNFGKGFKSFLNYSKNFILFLTVISGFSCHNSIAVLNGHLRKKSSFIRTPKFNIKSLNNTLNQNVYSKKSIPFNFLFDLFFTFYFFLSLCITFFINDGSFNLFPFHLILFIGYLYMVIISLKSTN
ncbi:MAG: glycosyl transferase family 2 [Flavobacteriaceae bacterium]|nr:glycosyl transferase family 2 [Flavobacteriaceae bacterium]